MQLQSTATVLVAWLVLLVETSSRLVQSLVLSPFDLWSPLLVRFRRHSSSSQSVIFPTLKCSAALFWQQNNGKSYISLTLSIFFYLVSEANLILIVFTCSLNASTSHVLSVLIVQSLIERAPLQHRISSSNSNSNYSLPTLHYSQNYFNVIKGKCLMWCYECVCVFECLLFVVFIRRSKGERGESMCLWRLIRTISSFKRTAQVSRRKVCW